MAASISARNLYGRVAFLRNGGFFGIGPADSLCGDSLSNHIENGTAFQTFPRNAGEARAGGAIPASQAARLVACGNARLRRVRSKVKPVFVQRKYRFDDPNPRTGPRKGKTNTGQSDLQLHPADRLERHSIPHRASLRPGCPDKAIPTASLLKQLAC